MNGVIILFYVCRTKGSDRWIGRDNQPMWIKCDWSLELHQAAYFPEIIKPEERPNIAWLYIKMSL